MSIRLPFIGRQRELSKVLSLAKEPDEKQVLFIEGDGGIGKTFLLHEARRQCQEQFGGELKVAEIIDFDNRDFHIPENVRNRIMSMLGEKYFDNYREAVKELRNLEEQEKKGTDLLEKKKEVRRLFSKEFNAFSKNKRVVLFFDTTDSLPATVVWDRLSNFILDVENVLFILAGRSSIQLIEILKSKLLDRVHEITLSPMSYEDSRNYLSRKQETLLQKITEKQTQNLIYIAQGRPILIDLGVEWLKRSINIDWLDQVTPKNPKNMTDEERKDRHRENKKWEYRLVNHISDLHDPLDKLVLVLSRIYPLTLGGVRAFFDCEARDPENLFDEVRDFVFIKEISGDEPAIALHDEMRRMVNEHVWPNYDPGGEFRKSDSKIAVAYFNSLIEECDRRIEEIESEAVHVPHKALALQGLNSRLETLRKQLIEHEIFVNLFDDFQQFIVECNRARRGYDFVFAKRLQDSIASLRPLFNEEQRYEFDTLQGRLYYRLNENDKAEALFNDLLSKNKDNKRRLAEIYNGLGVSEMNQGHLEEALKYQEDSLEIFREVDRKNVPYVANQVGLIYSKLENWNGAIFSFKEAFESTDSMEADPKDISDVRAGIKNYWGYAHAKRGEFELALECCMSAIETWESLDLGRKVARGYAVLGAVARMTGNFNLAEKCLDRAIAGIELPNDSERMIQAYSELGFTYHIMGPDKNGYFDTERIIKAQTYLENGVELAERYGERLELPLLMSRLSRLYWLYFQYKQSDYSADEIKEFKVLARDKNDEAYALGMQRVQTYAYTVAKCILGWAEFDIEDDEVANEEIPRYAEELNRLLKDTGKRYPLFSGRMHRILGEMQFEAEKFSESMRHYAKGLAQINEHGGYGVYRIERELRALTYKLEARFTKETEEALEHIRVLKKYWSDGRFGDPLQHTNLINWCWQQTAEVKMRANG